MVPKPIISMFKPLQKLFVSNNNVRFQIWIFKEPSHDTTDGSREMAEVAKSVVREESGGGEEEEDEPSLGDMIQAELRTLGGGWTTSVDGGWSTVEEVAKGIISPQTPSSPSSSPKGHVIEQLTPSNSVQSLTPAVSPPQSPLITNGHHLQEEVITHTEEVVVSNHVEEVVVTNHVEKVISTSSSEEAQVMSCVQSVIEDVLQQTVEEESSQKEVVETSTKVTEKKKSVGGEEGAEKCITTTKKKTKKTKKTEGKENHISVVENGHLEEESILPSSPSLLPVEDDDLSNVCVKNLKLNYVNETAKSFNGESKSSSEVPVLPAVPIRELRRSFGDIHKACENAETVLLDNETCEKQMKARSLGDLSRIDVRRKIVTGVSVKELAARYWRTVTIENNLNENNKEIGQLDKSSFNKFDQLSKKTVLHVRSSDPAKAQKTFSQGGSPEAQTTVLCKACEKAVFAMEQIKAERAVWHKNCFRCHTCKKQLTVDIYQSHEGLLYCKPHFRELFQPKVVLDEEEPASDKPDLGLEELGQLNVKSRFQVFEKHDQADGDLERSPTAVSVKRSSSILSKLAKFQKKGMDIGVTDESLNGFVYEESSSSEEEEEEDEEVEEERGVIKCRRKARERPVSFSKMDDVKRNWETVQQSQRREEMREERKQELQQIRSRLFQGKQGKMKELYEQAVADSEKSAVKKEAGEELMACSEKAKAVRERFEKGNTGGGEGGDGSKKAVEEDMAVFEEGFSKKSRSIFLEMEASAKSNPIMPGQNSPVRTESVRRPRETESPEREVYRDPDVVRCDDKIEDESAIKKSQTTSRMLSMFRQLEEQKEILPDGPKPKKCFTPPPDYKGGESSEEESGDEEEESEVEEEESETEEGVIKSSYKVKDEFLEQARHAAKAKELAAKFESWEPEKQSTNNAINMLDSEHASIESTRSLKARFESLQNELPKEKARPKVNRFVELPVAVLCAFCDRKVYPLEKIETNGKIFHKGCFRCSYCNCILRMDTYTLNNGHLYCLPHFKQLFISKGNYDEGFGSDQHKRKWEQPVNGNTSS